MNPKIAFKKPKKATNRGETGLNVSVVPPRSRPA
jgi:hypothetical protein